MTYPRIVIRFNGDRSTDQTVVREAKSRRTISRAAKTRSAGWGPILVGTFAALQEVGAYVNTYGGWVWRDEDGVEIGVEEIQP